MVDPPAHRPGFAACLARSFNFDPANQLFGPDRFGFCRKCRAARFLETDRRYR